MLWVFKVYIVSNNSVCIIFTIVFKVIPGEWTVVRWSYIVYV